MGQSGKTTAMDEIPGALRSPSEKSEPQAQICMGTARRIAVLVAAYLGLFLSFLDVSIVAVALATIAGQFQAYEQSNWVFNAYMLTYMAFGIILARLSDIFGILSVEIMSLTLFLAFSIGCALSRNMTELSVTHTVRWCVC
jgi:MFS family permease